jgi:uncharacterized lipoprotein YmbA
MISRRSGSIELKEHQRWAAPLDSEIRHALSDELTAQLGALDVYRVAHPAGRLVYRIEVNVKRFESVPGDGALIDTVWSVRRSSDRNPSDGKTVLICRSSEHEAIVKRSEAAQADYTDLVTAHRRALTRIATDIATAIRALAAPPADTHTVPAIDCPAATLVENMSPSPAARERGAKDPSI